MTYQCDCCGLMCSRTHKLIAYGTDTICCDDCCGYDYAAYDEPADAVLAHSRLKADLEASLQLLERKP